MTLIISGKNQLPDIVRGGSSISNISSSGGPTAGGIITSSEVQLFKKSIVKSMSMDIYRNGCTQNKIIKLSPLITEFRVS